MTKPTSYRLYVNLSASQTRKRLKRHGFGVKDIQASDRNQSVIIHTATGDHLEDLKSLFADVMPTTSRQELDTPVANLHNLGASSASWLRAVGVQTKADLERVGPAAAYRMVRRKYPRTRLNLLWAMAAALSDRDVSQLTDQEMAALRAAAEESD